ncbi:MAG: hypothetical protein NVSMB57_10560 [Actinomycetota bacterium]
MPPSSPQSPRRGRRVIIVLVGFLMMLSILYPLRQYGASKAQLRAMVRREKQIQEQIRTLQLQKKRLSSDAEAERLARAHLHYVRKGEVGFVLTGPPPSPKLAKPAHSGKAAAPHRAWYQSLWHWISGD